MVNMINAYGVLDRIKNNCYTYKEHICCDYGDKYLGYIISHVLRTLEKRETIIREGTVTREDFAQAVLDYKNNKELP